MQREGRSPSFQTEYYLLGIPPAEFPWGSVFCPSAHASGVGEVFPKCHQRQVDGIWELFKSNVKTEWTQFVTEGGAVLAEPENYITLSD